MNKEVAIIGAGGHTRSLINLVEKAGFAIIGIYDDSFIPSAEEFIGIYRLSGTIDDVPSRCLLILSSGNGLSRKELSSRFSGRILRHNLIHPQAVIEERVTIGNSNQVFARAYINSFSTVGNHNIINTGAILEHETVVGDFNHISIGSVLGGRVKIGNGCFIGAGAVIIDKISISDGVTVGAGTVVIRDITEPGTYVGNPSKRIR